MAPKNHVIPFYTRRDLDGREQAVCGQFVTAAELAPKETTPTCWGCGMWVENLDVIEPARVLATITEQTPWGETRSA